MRDAPSSVFQRVINCRVHWIVPVALVVGVCVLAVPWFSWKAGGAKWDITNEQLMEFQGRFFMYAAEKSILPSSLDEAVKAIEEDEIYGADMTKDMPLVMEGRDAWGNDIIYILESDGRRAVIRSVGSNGRDEGGAGDDLQVEVDIRWMDKE